MPKRRGIMDYTSAQKANLVDNGVLYDVLKERFRQDARWGEQNHRQMIWLGILAEEFGEAAKEINELYFNRAWSVARLRNELIQVAAVAVAMVESLDRNGK